ncbi:hypothetical protein [Paenibacillus xerothermodurans]|uniref:DUF3147 family protein n=1 Tax=Paenibacillus xerothermodurans TaxID=1977292 RepID=A0A2W1NAK3_PAEXE|nr:hypothetical protein [Paenibacillus xerothermodurans]PZE21699.1 hypothetical protein CBW46_004570 [Paenibacillus xerothermodurans]
MRAVRLIYSNKAGDWALGGTLIIKLIISVFIIVGLAEISKRTSPQVGGIIAGLPLGTGLSIYFISYEQGVGFAVAGMPWGIAGLAASLICCLTYLITARGAARGSRVLAIGYPTAASIAVFAGAGAILFSLEMNVLHSTAAFAAVFVLNLFIVNKLVNTQPHLSKSVSSILELVMRGIIVGLILLFITSIAAVVGSKWAGIFSSFPSTLFPLILLLHYEHGKDLFPHVIRGFSYSVSTLLVFYLAYLHLVPAYGLNVGFLLVYAVCALYLCSLRLLAASYKRAQ